MKILVFGAGAIGSAFGGFLSKAHDPACGDDHHPSMLQDLQRGKRTEIDSINGRIVKLGRQHGVPVPVNASLTRAIKKEERHAARFRGRTGKSLENWKLGEFCPDEG